MTAINSEDKFLRLIDRYFPNRAGQGLIALSRGDDAAVITPDRPLCVSTDLFVENRHFSRQWMTAEEAGYKALAVNISDMSAMGAKPFAFTMGLTVPRPLDGPFWDGFLRGMADMARRMGIALVGGDLVAASELGVCITIWGEPLAGRFLGRIGQGLAVDTDDPEAWSVFIVGGIGLASTGLAALRELGRERALAAYPKAVKAQLQPVIFQEQAAILAEEQGVAAMMDLSDGLARDLPRLLGPRLGLDLRMDQSFLDDELLDWCAEHGLDPIRWAIMGGEEYGLIGVAADNCLTGLMSGLPDFKVLGKVKSGSAILLNGRPYEERGFDHFD